MIRTVNINEVLILSINDKVRSATVECMVCKHSDQFSAFDSRIIPMHVFYIGYLKDLIKQHAHCREQSVQSCG